jgi:hypothetical protein
MLAEKPFRLCSRLAAAAMSLLSQKRPSTLAERGE